MLAAIALTSTLILLPQTKYSRRGAVLLTVLGWAIYWAWRAI
jgi:hypothetical protein